MYIEYKGDSLSGAGRIGRVRYSDSGKSLYYRDLHLFRFQGYKANYFDESTKDEYWVSGPRRDGNDSLYPAVVDIDEDVREEYWLDVRKMPERINDSKYQSAGK